MNKFVTFRDSDNEGTLQYYILQRDFPHYVGLISIVPVTDTLCCVPISGYSLYVLFSGTLRGNYVPSYATVMEEINSVFTNMAAWYYTERILKEEKKYSKFKIN